MPLGKGLPVKTPSFVTLRVWGLLSPCLPAFLDILQTSSSRPTQSLLEQPVRTVVTDLCFQAIPWVSWSVWDLLFRLSQSRKSSGFPTPLQSTGPQPADPPIEKAGRGPRLINFYSEEMGHMGSGTHLHPTWKISHCMNFFPYLRKKPESCSLGLGEGGMVT